MSGLENLSQSDRWDATNAVRLCEHCELDWGVSAGADKGDKACSACGAHKAPNVYVGLAEYDRLRALIFQRPGITDPMESRMEWERRVSEALERGEQRG